MIAYDKKRLDNLLESEQAKCFSRLDLINKDELRLIALAKQPAYHHSNIFIRIGVLLLTIILTFCSYGLLVLFFGLDSEWGFKIALIIFSIITFAALEFFIRNKNHFASGVDDGLLYFAFTCFATGVGFIIEPDSSLQLLTFYAILFIVSLFAFIRYTDRLAAIVCFVTFLLAIFYLTSQLGDISKLIMPFVMMIISASIYLFVSKKKQKYGLRFWYNGLEVLQGASLLSFYASGNYYVVREASVQFFNMQLEPGEDIPLSIFFYAFTISIPLLYVYFGLKKKDAIFLNCGLILIVATIATIRYYHSIMPIEIALILGGIILLSIAWFAYRLLKTPRNGFTIAEDKSESGWFSKDVEAIIMAQALAQQPAPPQADNNNFGGGKFGGGGAGENF
ncbi:MAG: hypothetical protein ABI723_05785 [Bacteroidia bacterium]